MALPPIITIMKKASEKAARSLLRDFNEVENLQISVKGPGDFVTAADRRAEQTIHDELKAARPDFGFLMEESGEIEGAEGCTSRWIIDPLDGTTNFLHGLPHWCISIALEEAGKITAAVVHAPVYDELFYATAGGGAWLRGNKRLRVSGRKDLNMCVIDTSGTSFETRQKVRPHVAAMRSHGATALNLAYVSCGRLDAYFDGNQKNRRPKAWDIAAGYLLVKEAGGYATEITGKSNPVHNENILAGNEFVHGALKDLLNKP